MRRIAVLLSTVFAVVISGGAVDFDAGADLRVRQELVDNAPLLCGDGKIGNHGISSTPGIKSAGYINRMRYRVRAWGELKLDESLRIYTRLTDEFHWNIQPNRRSLVFPNEVFLDNLFIEGKGYFDGLLDFTLGRQDIYGLYGLDHVFQDGTPNDGSRSLFADMARFALDFTQSSRIDLFGMYLQDCNHLRWGDSRSFRRSLTGLGESGAEPERDEWGDRKSVV